MAREELASLMDWYGARKPATFSLHPEIGNIAATCRGKDGVELGWLDPADGRRWFAGVRTVFTRIQGLCLV
jgi:hypothetical protein